MTRGSRKKARKLKQKYPSQKERLSVYDVQYILPMIMDIPVRVGKVHKVMFGDIPVNLANDRLRTFLHSGTVCVACAMEGEFFALERFCDTDDYHLNLYGRKDGHEVLFTKDHIVPRSKGGPSHLDNYQTMCAFCNGEKGNGVLPRIEVDLPCCAVALSATTDDQILIFN